jgi:hypothetical protein
MPTGATRSKCGFRKLVAPEPVSATELDSAERILVRLVAIAYAGDHPDLFTPGTSNRPDGRTTSPFAVESVAQTVSAGRSCTI